MSLKDGSKKMSKSELSDLSRINLTDGNDKILNKIKKAKTDSLSIPSTVKELNDRPEARNLMSIYSSISNSTLESSIQKFSGKNFSEFKENLSQILIDKLSPISDEIKRLLKEKSYLDKILEEGSKKADIIASKKIKEIHDIIGF